MFDLSTWLGLLGIGGVGFGALAWMFGLTHVIRILATALEIVSPVLKGILELAVDWVKILWDGTKTILASWKAIAVVATLMGGAYLYDKADDVRKNYVHKKEIQQCEAKKGYDFKTKKRMPSSQTPNPWNPLEWRF